MIKIKPEARDDAVSLVPWAANGIGYGEVAGEYASHTFVAPRIAAGEKTLVIATIGQSNICNSVDFDTFGFFTPANAKVENFNFITGANYRAKDRMLGCHGIGANMASWLGDLLINNAKCARVIFAPIGMSGSGSQQWAAGGNLNQRIKALSMRLQSVGLQCDIVLHHQGEADTTTLQATLTANYQSMIDTWRAVGIGCPILISKTSWISNASQSTASVRNAQTAVVNPSLGVYAGPDTDTLGASYRMSDQLHFNKASGAPAFAQLAYDKIAPLI